NVIAVWLRFAHRSNRRRFSNDRKKTTQLRMALNDRPCPLYKIVEWSDEDQCFVGQCPGVIGPCCHGDNEAEVYAQLCEIVEEWIETMKRDGKPLPPPTAGRDLAQKIA